MKEYKEKTSNDMLQEQLKEIFGDKTPEEAREMLLTFRRLMSCYQCAMLEIETKFRVLNEEFSLLHDRNPINNIHTRLKNGVSIREKMIRKNLPPSIEAIEEGIADIAGIRVVCAFVSDVYYLEKALLEQDDIILIKRKDYISSPKENGYRSLHLIIAIPIFLSNQKRIMKVEVQLRTVAMDSWASLEHQLRYKKDLTDHQEIETALLKCARMSNELDTTMDHLREIVIKDNYMMS
jgi:putative GTP pyrophosphokinase